MYQRLQQCAKIPDFNNYLAFILTQGEGTQDEIRQTAGLLLKNNLKTGWQSTEPAHQAYIQRALLPALGHPNRFLRHIVLMLLPAIKMKLKYLKRELLYLNYNSRDLQVL